MSNTIILIGLLAISYVFFSSGMEFLALLMLVLAAMLFLSGSAQSSASPNVSVTEPFGPQGPIVVENKLPEIPERINFKIKPNWHEYMGFEYAMFNFGFAMNNLFHFFYNLMTGTKTGKKKDAGGH